jgi:predicted HicB family RNase H-like nuclease
MATTWTVRVPDTVRQAVETQALRDRITVSAWIRRAVEQAAGVGEPWTQYQA